MKLFRTVTDILKSFLHIGYYCKMSSNVRWHCSHTPLSPYPYHQPPPDVSGVHWMTSLLSVAPTRIPDLWGQRLESLLSPTQHPAQPRTGPGTWWVFEKWEEAWVQILVLPCICCAASSKLPDLSGPTSLSVEWEYNNDNHACMYRQACKKVAPSSTSQHHIWVSGDILGCHNLGGGCHWQLVGRGQGCCWVPYNAWFSPPLQRIMHLKLS